jgi:hypothetical protein
VFGLYVWDAMSGNPSTLKVDDIIVCDETMSSYEEHFTNGIPALNWFSAWGNYTPMTPLNQTSPSDTWIGSVTTDLDSLGGLGGVLAGNMQLTDYSVEAQIYLELNSGYYKGIMMRVDTTGKIVGYQFLMNYNQSLGAQKLRFRYFSENRTEIRNLADIQAVDLPGGAPTTEGWHKMKIKAVGNHFWLYWDDQPLAGNPYTDPNAALSKGMFGVYVWDAMSGNPSTIKVDDIIIRNEISSDVEFSDLVNVPKEFLLSQNYPNPFNPETRINYQINRTEFVKLSVYNLLGEKVTTLVSETQIPNSYTVIWNGKDDQGKDVPSGAYIYTLKLNRSSQSFRMMLVR